MITDDKSFERKSHSESGKFRRMIQPEQEKFVPTCSICGEQHWPHHPSIPCINVNKAKVLAKAEKKAEKKAKAAAAGEAAEKARAAGADLVGPFRSADDQRTSHGRDV